MIKSEKSLLLSLLKERAFLKKRVKLSSGKTSNYYLDVRRVSLSSKGIYLISHLIWELIKQEEISAIGGPTLGADAIVCGVCMFAYQQERELKGFLVRKEPKRYGEGKLIEGAPLTQGEKVIVVDDVVTTGSSLVRVIEALKIYSVKVVKLVAVVDREEGAKENLAKWGIPFVSIFTIKDFL